MHQKFSQKISFFSSKIKFPIACTLLSFTNFPVVDAILPVTAKHAGI